MATDLRQLSSAQVLTLINTDNATDLTLDVIGFSAPVALEGDSEGRNTALTVLSKPNSGYAGTVDVKYNRLDLEGFMQYGEPVLVIPDAGSMNDIVEAFNTFYDANLVLEEDLVPLTDLSAIDYVGAPLTLTATNASLAYHGNIDITVRYESELLSTIITRGYLDGLKWPGVQGDPIIGNIELKAPGILSSQHLANVIDDKMYVTGGNGSSASVDGKSVFSIYDFINDSWEHGVAPRILKRTFDAVVGRKLYYFGDSGATSTSYSIDIYDVDAEIWSTRTMPFRYWDGSSSSIGNLIYLCGGSKDGVLTNECWTYNVDTEEWNQLSSMPITTDHFDTCIYNGKLYLFGGGETGSGGYVLGTLYCYDPATDNWTQLADGPVTLRFHTFVECNGFMYVFGGHTGSTTNNHLFRYNPLDDTWFDYGPLDTSVIYYHSCVVYRDSLYVYGGISTTTTDRLIKVS